MPASLAASARLMPSRALATASIRKAARRFASCRACRRSASGVSSFRIGSAAPIIPSLAGRRSCPPGEHASRTPKSQFIRAAVSLPEVAVPYVFRVPDMFHYIDRDEEYALPPFATLVEAEQAA